MLMKHCLRLSLSGRLPLSPWGPAVAIGGNEAPSYSLPSPVNMGTDSSIQSSDYVLSKNRMQINLLKQLTYPTAQSAARAVSGVISRPTYSPPLKIAGLAVIAMCSATSCRSQHSRCHRDWRRTRLFQSSFQYPGAYPNRRVFARFRSPVARECHLQRRILR
jgi:hypothetical protein